MWSLFLRQEFSTKVNVRPGPESSCPSANENSLDEEKDRTLDDQNDGFDLADGLMASANYA